LPGNSNPPVALSWFPAEKQQTLRLVPESVLESGYSNAVMPLSTITARRLW